MITGLHHVAVVVRSADAALGFFRDTMGLEVTKDEVVEAMGIRGVLMPLGENEIELIEPTRPDTGVARYLESRGERLHHLAFSTDDIAGELARLRGLGVELVDQEPREGLTGMVAFIHPKAMHGVLIELVQPPAGAHGEPARSAAKGIDHLAILVADYAAARATWSNVLGLEVTNEIRGEGRPNIVAQVPVGQCMIELISAAKPDSPLVQRIADQGEGANSMVAIEVKDMAAQLEKYRAAGKTPPDAAPGPLPHSITSTIPADQCFGLGVQLIEYGH